MPLGRFGGDVVGGFQTAQVVPEADTATEENRRDRDVELVDEPGHQEVTHHRGAAAHADVLALGGLQRAVERLLWRCREEVERRSAGHLDRRPWDAVRENEHRAPERRLVAPPAAPVRVVREVVQAEHPRAHDLCSNAREVRLRVLVIHTGRASTRGVVQDALLHGPGRDVGGDQP